MIEAVLCRAYTVLAYNGILFAEHSAHHLLSANPLRHDLRRERIEHQCIDAKPPLDRWLRRALESHHKDGDRQACPLRTHDELRRLLCYRRFRPTVEGTEPFHAV